MTTGGPDFCTPEVPPAVGSTLENVEEWNPVEAGLAPPVKKSHAKEGKANKESKKEEEDADKEGKDHEAGGIEKE